MGSWASAGNYTDLPAANKPPNRPIGAHGSCQWAQREFHQGHMEFDLDHQDQWTIARPRGPRIDAAAAPALKGMIVDLANQQRFHVVVDLSRIDFVDSSGLGALINAHKTLEARGRLVLCAVPAKVLSLLKLTRLDRVFRIAADATEAKTLA